MNWFIFRIDYFKCYRIRIIFGYYYYYTFFHNYVELLLACNVPRIFLFIPIFQVDACEICFEFLIKTKPIINRKYQY